MLLTIGADVIFTVCCQCTRGCWRKPLVAYRAKVQDAGSTQDAVLHKDVACTTHMYSQNSAAASQLQCAGQRLGVGAGLTHRYCRPPAGTCQYTLTLPYPDATTLSWLRQLLSACAARCPAGISGASYYEGSFSNIARSPSGDYVAVSSRGNFFMTWTPGQVGGAGGQGRRWRF